MKSTLWTAEPNAELFHCKTADEAIEEYLDSCDVLPEKVTAIGYAPREIDEKFRTLLATGIIERLFEDLDDEFAIDEPGDDATYEQAQKQYQMARALVDEVVASYHVFQCEPSGEIKEIETMQWVREHRPDWIKYEMKDEVVAPVVRKVQPCPA